MSENNLTGLLSRDLKKGAKVYMFKGCGIHTIALEADGTLKKLIGSKWAEIQPSATVDKKDE